MPRWAVTRPALMLSAVLMAACSGHSESSAAFSDGTSWSITDCASVASGDNITGPLAATPQEAVDKLVATGKVATTQVPTTGWHVIKQRSTSAEFKSGKDLLLVTGVTNAWRVTEYALCVSTHVPTYTITSSR